MVPAGSPFAEASHGRGSLRVVRAGLRAGLATAGLIGVALLSPTALAQEAPAGSGLTALVGPLGLPQVDSRQTQTVAPLLQPQDRFSLTLNQNGRLSLRFDMRERLTETLPREEVEAGAYYQISPRLRVGGSLSIQAESFDPGRVRTPQDVDAGIRLESAFRF